MRSSRGLESSQQLFSIVYVLCFVCIWVLLSCFSRASTLILGTLKDCITLLEILGFTTVVCN
jgi:hypothetical protein